MTFSMTTLLPKAFTHFTGSSFLLKTKKYSHILFFSFCDQLSKHCQKWQNSFFQSQFCMPKMVQIFPIFCSLKNISLEADFFGFDIIGQLQIFKAHYLNARPKQIL